MTLEGRVLSDDLSRDPAVAGWHQGVLTMTREGTVDYTVPL
jgi:hypothetical protein